MALTKPDLKMIFERMIFGETTPKDWSEDVYTFSPMLGDSAGKLLEAFDYLVALCPEDDFKSLVAQIYQESQKEEQI